MRNSGLIIIYLIFIVAQIILNNVFNLSQYIILSFLPAMIVCLPSQSNTGINLLIAFAIGFIVDFFSTGMVGMTAVALLPVAFVRNTLLTFIFGEEYFSRRDDIMSDIQGIRRTIICVEISLLLYLLIYIIVDSAGTRPFGFNLLRFLISFIICSGASIFILQNFSSKDSNSRWN